MRYLFRNSFLHFIKYMRCHVAKARANTEWYSFPVRDLTSVNVASLSSKLQLFSLPLPWMYSPFCVSLLDKKKRIETSRGTHEGKAKIIIGARYWSLSVHLQFLDLGCSTPQVRSSRHKNAMVALLEFLEWLLWSFWQKTKLFEGRVLFGGNVFKILARCILCNISSMRRRVRSSKRAENTTRSGVVFDELRGDSSGDETLCRMLDITSQTKWLLEGKI